MGLSSLIADPSIPDGVKIAVLRKKGMSQSLAERAVTATSGERTYEKFERDPARKALSYLPGGKTIGDYAIPSDLQSLDETIGGGIGTAVGHPFWGAQIGGMLGGIAQGRGAGESAMRAAPGAAANMIVPAFLKRVFSSQIAKAMSAKASAATGSAVKKLFKRMNLDDLNMTPQGIANFFAQGDASPAMQRASGTLSNFRNILRTQPAFRRLVVRVPIKTFPQGPQGPASIGWHPMSLPDAMDYQTQLYGKGYLVAGGPRGGVQAEPDRQLGGYVRQAIGKAIGTVNPKFAQQYSDLSHDYGVAATMNEIFPKAVTPQGMLNHEEIYNKVSDPKRLSHLENLVGPQDTRKFLSEIAPGRQRIAEPQGGAGARMHVPGLPVSVHAGILHGPPTGPAAFAPAWPKIAGPVSSQAATQAIEGEQ